MPQCSRRCGWSGAPFWTLLWAGVIVLALSGTLDAAEDLETPTITSAADAREVIQSPQVLLILAPAARLGSGWLALLAIYPLARRFQRHADRETRRTGRHPAVWSDRWYLVRALRDLRPIRPDVHSDISLSCAGNDIPREARPTSGDPTMLFVRS